MKKITVLVVDDSALIRNLLSDIINESEYLEVVGTAEDPFDARDKIKVLRPDVLTLDIEMPKMDGITFLKNIMRLRPMPVLMISTLTEKGSDITLQALELGAVDYIPKLKISVAEELPKLARDIVAKIHIAAKANVEKMGAMPLSSPPAHMTTARPLPSSTAMPTHPHHSVDLIVIGASTGGVEATKRLLAHLPDHMPPIAIVQHMPAYFTSSYAKRLDDSLTLTVEEFSGGEQPLLVNHVYIANGAQHLAVKTNSLGKLVGYCLDSEPIHRHKPSVDVLFQSAAKALGSAAIGVLLTGMGIDGADGMGSMKKSGATTIAQDEATSVVWGMPRIAIEAGAVDHILPLDNMATFIVNRCGSFV